MKNLRKAGVLLIVSALLVLASACASSRPPYRKHKPRRPAGCDCSRWSTILPGNPVYYYDRETQPAGRA